MKKFMISLLTAMLVLGFCTCTASARSFSDVPSSHWAYNYIEEAVEKGFVNGVGSGKYDPNGQISNAQFITMMTRAFAKDKLSQGNANSSASSQWWEPYLKTAYDNRFLNGMTAGTAMQSGNSAQLRTVVEQPINRFDMAEAIQNMMNRLGVKKPSSEMISKTRSAIPDYKNIPSSHQQAVEIAYSSGCLTGIDEKGTFSGNSGMTRAQAAVVLIRLDELSRTGTITNKVVESSLYGDLTEGYWVCFGMRIDNDYLYRFHPDGTYIAILASQTTEKSLDNIKSTYEIHENRLYIDIPGGLFENTPSGIKELVYDANQKCWSGTEQNGKEFWKELRRNGSFDSDAPISWIQKIPAKQGVEYEIHENRNISNRTTVNDVDFIVNKIHDPQREKYFFFTIETKKDSEFHPTTQVYSFAIAGEGLGMFLKDTEIHELYQDNEVLIAEIWIGVGWWKTIVFNKSNGNLTVLPDEEFHILNSNYIFGKTWTPAADEPACVWLYTTKGELIAVLITEKYLPQINLDDDYIYYTFLEDPPTWNENDTYAIWRYDLTSGKREQVYSLTCDSIEEMGDGYVKYSKPDSDKVYTAWY